MTDQRLILRRFGEEERVIDTKGEEEISGHGGGDFGLMDDFCAAIEQGAEALTGIDASVESHVMALAAEHSRLHGGETVVLEEFDR